MTITATHPACDVDLGPAVAHFLGLVQSMVSPPVACPADCGLPAGLAG